MSVDPTSIVSNELVGTSSGTISRKFQKASTFSHKNTHRGGWHQQSRGTTTTLARRRAAEARVRVGMCGLRLSWFRLECRAQHHDEWTSAVLSTQTRVCPKTSLSRSCARSCRPTCATGAPCGGLSAPTWRGRLASCAAVRLVYWQSICWSRQASVVALALGRCASRSLSLSSACWACASSHASRPARRSAQPCDREQVGT